MLKHLQIRDFAIIPSLELELTDGFTAITGETGAGKSILVDALGLLLGERADSAGVRHGADRAELAATFELAADGEAAEWLRAAELDDDGQCLLRRVVGANGRSRAWINGRPVTMQQLQELGAHLVEIHGQNQHLALNQPREQLALLDAGDDHPEPLAATRRAFRDWRAAQDELRIRLEEVQGDGADLDYLRFQCRELGPVALSAEGYAELEQEHRLLSRGGSLVEDLQHALDTVQGEHGAEAALNRAVARLDEHEGLDAALDDALKLLREAVINAQEAAAGLQRCLDGVDLDPQRLETLDRQLSALHDLARKHRVAPAELGQLLTDLSARLERLEQFDAERERLERHVAERLDAYRAAAAALHAARAERAGALAQEVSERMAELGMPGGRFEIAVEHRADELPRADGGDRVTLRVSANPGTPPGPLGKIASGGELSRISLALRLASSGDTAGRTQVFDEVDAGIGGDTARVVGRLLARLAEHGQSLCVTHLAQVAVCAGTQFRVSKLAGDSSTRVDVTRLGGAQRVDEVARMLGGEVTEQSRAHAAELLAAAGQKVA